MLPTLYAYTPREIAHKIETLGVTKYLAVVIHIRIQNCIK